MELEVLHDFVEPNGKTIRENNLEIQHRIPLGTLVEVKFNEWFGDGACWKVHARLWVVSHDRDCDGTPLYSLNQWNDYGDAIRSKDYHSGFSEESLTVVEITNAVKIGDDVLEWPDE